MARLVDARFWAQFPADDSREALPTRAESDQWDECDERMRGGTWLAKRGEDFTDAEKFRDELWSRAHAANLGVDVVWRTDRVIFRFRPFLTPERKKEVLDFSKPMPARDEETGEYLGYWWLPDGTWIHLPINWSPKDSVHATDDAA